MEHQKIILKLVLLSGKIAYKMLAVSAEVFCRRSFGRRYAPTLLASFFFCMVALALLQGGMRQHSQAIISDYLTIYFVLVLYHIGGMWRRRATIQSYSNGQSWEFWQRLNVNPIIVKTLIDPLILIIVGILIYQTNHLLSIWLQLGGICLFIKEFLAYLEYGNRVLDSIDARLEGERIGTGVRQQTNPQGGGEQRVSPLVAVEPDQQPASPIQQIYSRLDPALQRLITTPNQNRPATRAPIRPANRPAVTRNQNRPVVKRPRINGSHQRPKPPWES